MFGKLAATVLAGVGLGTGVPMQPAHHAAHSSRSQAIPVLFVVGHGWGHGVGLAQYGAYGYALHGWSYDRIVEHYFPGTTLDQADRHNVRVLLQAGARR